VAACVFSAAVSRRAPDPAKKTPVGAEASQNYIYSGDVSFTDNDRSYLIFSMHTQNQAQFRQLPVIVMSFIFSQLF
jgi:hypothetical protein